MARLFGFDYKSPYYYMVTLKRCDGLADFSQIGAGGRWIILSPEGFGPRWHPPRQKEKFCAQGRMLFLSLYPADTHKPDNATLYRRCHEMGDIVARENDE